MSKNKFYHNNNNKKKFDAQVEAQKVLEANKGKNQNFLKPIE